MQTTVHYKNPRLPETIHQRKVGRTKRKRRTTRRQTLEEGSTLREMKQPQSTGGSTARTGRVVSIKKWPTSGLREGWLWGGGTHGGGRVGRAPEGGGGPGTHEGRNEEQKAAGREEPNYHLRIRKNNRTKGGLVTETA